MEIAEEELPEEIARLVQRATAMNFSATLAQTDKALRVRIGRVNEALMRVGFKMIVFPSASAAQALDYKLYLYPETERPTRPRYLNVGAGRWSHPFWHNLDNPSDHYAPMQTAEFISVDLLTKPRLPIEGGTLAAIYSSHVVEHLTDEADASLFAEAYRALESGGIFRITCPDHGMLLDAYRRGDFVMTDAQPHLRLAPEHHIVSFIATELILAKLGDEEAGPHAPAPEEVRRILLDLPEAEALDHFTHQCNPDRNSLEPGWHRNWMSVPKLTRMLREAGFEDVYESRPQQSRSPYMRHPRLFDVAGPNISLYIEARKA